MFIELRCLGGATYEAQYQELPAKPGFLIEPLCSPNTSKTDTHFEAGPLENRWNDHASAGTPCSNLAHHQTRTVQLPLTNAAIFKPLRLSLIGQPATPWLVICEGLCDGFCCKVMAILRAISV